MLVFLSVFAVLVLVMQASGAGASKETKKAMATLGLALAMDSTGSRDDIVDVRKHEILSAMPFLNRWLAGVELAPKLRLLLHQADLKWTGWWSLADDVSPASCSLPIRSTIGRARGFPLWPVVC